MESILPGFLLAIPAYMLPGFLLLSCVRLPGIHPAKRLLLSLPVSILLVPALFSAAANFLPIVPSLSLLLLFSGGLLVIAILLHRFNRRPHLTFFSRSGIPPAGKLEWVVVSLLIGFLVAVFNAPRLDTIIHGAIANETGLWDVRWQIQELLSVVQTGLPPRHFFFPDISMAYYYWSLVLPAILVNQPFAAISLGQALAVHSVLQAGACMGLTYWLLRSNFPGWAGRAVGFSLLTFAGGFDAFVALKPDFFEAWQQTVSWLVSNNAIASMSERYMETPQHLAAFLAAIWAILLWRNIRASGTLRLSWLALVCCFCIGTSPEAFISMAIGILLWAVVYRSVWIRRIRRDLLAPSSPRIRIERLRSVFLASACLLVIFLLCAFQQLRLSATNSTLLSWNNFRVPLLEHYLGTDSGRIDLADRLITLIGLPIVSFWVLLVELGLPVFLFLSWLLYHSSRIRFGWKNFLAIFPLLIFPLTFVLRDTAQANNFSRNAAIPAQLIIVLAALLVFPSKFPDRSRWRWQILAGYALMIGLAAQTFSTFVSWNMRTRPVFGSVWHVDRYVSIAVIPIAQPSLPWPESMRYILWANVHTPVHAIFVEETPSTDDPHFRLLERLRFLDARTAPSMLWFSQDSELLVHAQFNAFRDHLSGSTLLDFVGQSAYLSSSGAPFYYVSRSGEHTDLGHPVYVDSFVFIYLLPTDSH